MLPHLLCDNTELLYHKTYIGKNNTNIINKSDHIHDNEKVPINYVWYRLRKLNPYQLFGTNKCTSVKTERHIDSDIYPVFEEKCRERGLYS